MRPTVTNPVGWSVGLAQHWTLQKRLNRSRCLPFGLRTRTGPGNHVLDEVQIPPWEGATLRGRAAYCIRTLCRELCKNGWTDRKAVWDWDSGGPKEACLRWGAHWRHLANTTKLTMCGGDAACCQITLTAYFICFIDCCIWNKVYSSWVLNSVSKPMNCIKWWYCRWPWITTNTPKTTYRPICQFWIILPILEMSSNVDHSMY